MQILNVNADVAAREMAIAVQPLKTIFINSKVTARTFDMLPPSSSLSYASGHHI